MSRFRITLTVLVVLALTSGTALAQGRGGGQGNGRGNGQGNRQGNGSECSQALYERFELLAAEELSSDEAAAIFHMREEEKLARDVYMTLATSWDLPIFTNIARAEQRHMDLVGLLLTRYALEDPITDDTIGVFSNPQFTSLYQDLVASGRNSLIDALIVGATIEDLDIKDLVVMLDESYNMDIDLILENLNKGSRNHMRAFSRTLLNNGGAPYQAQYLTQDEIDEIIASEREIRVVYDEFGDVLATCEGRGGRGGRGGGRGGNGGQGNGGLRDGSCLKSPSTK